MKWLGVKHPLTAEEIDAVEQTFSIHLPADYKQLIGQLNGAALRNYAVFVPNVGDVPYTRNVSLCESSPANVYALFPAINSQSPGLFPFAGTGNGDFFCFDLLKSRVVLWLHETKQTFPVCKSFTDLINSLNYKR